MSRPVRRVPDEETCAAFVALGGERLGCGLGTSRSDPRTSGKASALAGNPGARRDGGLDA